MSLYDEIGRDTIEKAIREFYSRAVIDPLIAHFFFNVDVESLIAKQVEFTCRMLGFKEPQANPGRPLKAAHAPLKIRPVHFSRRQKLMQSVLTDLGFSEEHSKAWLKLEAQLKPLIIRDSSSCIE